MTIKKLTVDDPEYKTKALTACMEIGKLFTSTFDFQKILEYIMKKISQLIDAENWSLLLKDEDTGDLIFKIVAGDKNDLINNVRLAKGQGIAGCVAETGKPEFIRDISQHPKFCSAIDTRTGFNTTSIVCIPLKTHGKVLGVIEIINVKSMAVFETVYFPVLNILADYAAIALENSRSFHKMKKMSITDEYTGLYNARYLHKVLDERILKSDINKGIPFAVVFVDIDDFKDVVDTCGHLLGSQVLKEVGQTIYSCLSMDDILIKYGGDEYVIILNGKNRQQAKRHIEEILHTIRSTIYLPENKNVRLTASFGIAIYPNDADTKKELLLLADKTMYTIKQTTKNGVGST